MPRPVDDDLLAPELTEADDAVGFDHPWNPWSLVTLSFFCGLLAGGSLLALNFDRLGMPGRRIPTLVIVIAVTTAGVLGTAWAVGTGVVGGTNRETQQMSRWALRGAFILVAIAIAALQRQRFRLFQASGQPAGHLLRPAVIASALSLLYQLAIGTVAYMLFRR
jgi:hypothetical protein